MNDKPQLENQEVDLGQLFNAIGRLFDKFFGLIRSILEFFFNVIIGSSKAVINNFKILFGIVLISGIVGFAIDYIKPDKFESSMLVRTYFDSKYQLATNLNYYNNLLADQRYPELAEIFNIDTTQIKHITNFELLAGPENENSKLAAYYEFMRSVDSTLIEELSYEEYVENRDIFSRDLFEIKVQSMDKSVFKYLDIGINKSFDNRYSNKKKEKRDSVLLLRRETILEALTETQELQKVYINVLEEESQVTKTRISLGDGFPLQQEKTDTKEFQLLNKEIALRNELRDIDQELIQESDFFDVISTFQETGIEVSDIWSKYTILLPVLSFVVLILGYLGNSYVRFVKNYEL